MLKQLREMRKRKGLTQEMLAADLGVSQQAVAKWEAGRALPAPEMLLHLAHYFGISLEYLLAGQDTQANNPFPRRLQPVMLPVIGTVKAGYGLPAYEEDQGQEPAFVREPQDYFYLVVQGDSMEPYIREGDLALVRRQPVLENGDLGVVIYGEEEGTLKRFRQERGRVVLEAFNPAYEPYVIEGEDLTRLQIAGRVMETKTRW